MKEALLKTAEEYCIAQKQRVTEPRIEVLKIIAASVKPLGAYEVLQHLGEKINNPKPPTAYRAIDFGRNMGLSIVSKV